MISVKSVSLTRIRNNSSFVNAVNAKVSLYTTCELCNRVKTARKTGPITTLRRSPQGHKRSLADNCSERFFSVRCKITN